MNVASPKQMALNQKKITKSLNTLMGIVSGIVCDGQLHDTEIHYLSTWANENADIASVYPANVVYRRVKEVLLDGIVTADEKEHLLNELTILSGTDFANTGSALPEHISTIFDDDPHILFPQKVFVFTGEFIFGTRASCHRAIETRGGVAATNVSGKTNYLVIGSMSSPDWIVANFGRKIQKAAELISTGEHELAVVREQDWAMAL